VQGELTWNAARGPGVLDAGVAARHEWIEADRLSTETSAITGVEPFAQYTAPLGSFIVTPGVRVSWSDRWGQFVAPRFAAMVRPNEKLAIRASIGRGFRAPDFKELYLSFVNTAAGYAVYGNPDSRTRAVHEHVASARNGRTRAPTSGQRPTTPTTRTSSKRARRTPTGSTRTTTSPMAGPRGLEVESGILLRAWRTGRRWRTDSGRAISLPIARLLGRTPLTLRGSVTSPTLYATRATLRLAYASRTPVFRDELTG
jgi:outer membrane receptor for ferrienterochelin and colicins